MYSICVVGLTLVVVSAFPALYPCMLRISFLPQANHARFAWVFFCCFLPLLVLVVSFL